MIRLWKQKQNASFSFWKRRTVHIVDIKKERERALPCRLNECWETLKIKGRRVASSVKRSGSSAPGRCKLRTTGYSPHLIVSRRRPLTRVSVDHSCSVFAHSHFPPRFRRLLSIVETRGKASTLCSFFLKPRHKLALTGDSGRVLQRCHEFQTIWNFANGFKRGAVLASLRHLPGHADAVGVVDDSFRGPRKWGTCCGK